MAKFYFILLSLSINNIFSAQSISPNIDAYYEFKLCNSPHTIVLKKNNRKYSGFIETSLKRNNSKEIRRKTKISYDQAKKVIFELKKYQIDDIDENYDDDSLFALDGDYMTVILLRKTKVEKFNFDEIYPSSSRVIEKTPLRSKIQQWLTVLDEELKLKEVWSGVKNKLTKGTYCYNSGAIYTNCFEIK